MSSMTPEEREALLAKPLNAIVAVPRRSGGPQLTPVWFHWDGHAFYFSTTRSRTKYANIKRHPEISLIVDDLAAHLYVAAYGHAEIIEDDRVQVIALTQPIMEKYAPGRAEQMLADLAPDRVIVILRPTKIVDR
jgi:PPOX class probable F420-dependent enzyme